MKSIRITIKLMQKMMCLIVFSIHLYIMQLTRAQHNVVVLHNGISYLYFKKNCHSLFLFNRNLKESKPQPYFGLISYDEKVLEKFYHDHGSSKALQQAMVLLQMLGRALNTPQEALSPRYSEKLGSEKIGSFPQNNLGMQPQFYPSKILSQVSENHHYVKYTALLSLTRIFLQKNRIFVKIRAKENPYIPAYFTDGMLNLSEQQFCTTRLNSSF